jgi:thiamine transport system substrate-binding protein
MIQEHSDRYQAAQFSEGQYLQIEVAGVTVNGAKNPLSAKFLAFMTSPAFQDIIPTTNWMLPAANTEKPLDPAFGRLVQPTKPLYFSPQEVADHRKEWITEWLSVMSK